MTQGFLTINQVLERELGIRTSSMSYTISCGLITDHRDSNPSCRVYPESDDGVGSLFCFGCGFSASPVSLVHTIHRHQNYAETFNYIREFYGVVYDTNYSRDIAVSPVFESVKCLKWHKNKDVEFLQKLSRAIATIKPNSHSNIVAEMISDTIKEGI